ncbi:hypothetical protein AQUCO_02200266v1 [Aquilegia coerulea]|uniref:F-box domain-containing protein n=1 Tax=Aquilegia coerulea TaxID=218851 RepID=A0A2G5DDX2_AQUCA|nr:hypothetical protein AQUCO_02200266v1 [Aquilegia coerulea]
MASSQLPYELILEILSRVPSQSLARFRCVCKPWCDLIHDSSFSKLRVFRAIERGDDVVNLLVHKNILVSKKQLFKNKVQTTHNIIDSKGNYISFGDGAGLFRKSLIYYVEGTSFDFGFEVENPFSKSFSSIGSNIAGSCNGIVCLVRDNVVCLWNPCTAEYKIANFNEDIYLHMFILGFGYDASKDDYKIVWIYNSGKYECKVNIYSLKDATWSTMSKVPYEIQNKLHEPGIFLNGGLHWIAKSKVSCYEIVICFNVEENVFREIPKPDCVDERAHIILGILGRQLCMLSKYFGTDIEIWVMKDYGQNDSWTKLFAIDETIMGYAKNSYPSFDEQYPTPLCFANNDEVLLRDDRGLLLYGSEKKSAKNVKIHGIGDGFYHCAVVTHVPSLVSLHSGTYMGTDHEDERKVNKRMFKGPDK